MQVTYKDHMGSDLTVVNAARVSFDKESDWEYECEYIDDPYQCAQCVNTRHCLNEVLSDKDKKLIKYLADHNHWSPFSHPQVQLHVKAPIFVARQLQKHTVGCAWNEVSRRYVDSEPEFYWPDKWRGKAEDKKQGSGDWSVPEDSMGFLQVQTNYNQWEGAEYTHLEEIIKDIYNDIIDSNIAPEQARMILPQNMLTEWYWTGSLYYFARVCQLRLKSDAQAESQEIARQISEIIEPLFPVSWSNLVHDGSITP